MERGVGLAARDGSEGCVVGDRLEDLRGWWQRTRRRRLKPAVQAAVGRGRPTAATHPAEPAPPPPDPSDEPAAVTAELPEPTEAEPVEQPEAEPVEPAPVEPVEPVEQPEAEQVEQVGPEPEQSDPEPEPVEPEPELEQVEQPVAEQVGPQPVEPEPKPADTPESEPEPWPASTGQAAVPELAWAAPGSAPWEVKPVEPAAPDADPAAPDAVAAVDASDAAVLDAEAAPALDADAPRTSDDPSAPWWGVAPPAAAATPAAESVTPTDPDPALAPGPAAASTPDAAAAARSDDPLDLDDDQRRWLGRGVGLVEGIGPAYGSQLEVVGVSTLQDLLLRGATRRGRQEIADRTGISGRLIMRWVNNADLFRIRGVGTQYADLLEASGVDTVVELALRRPDNLAARLKTTNDIRSLVHQVPTEAQVADWVAQAKGLPRIVAY